MGFHLVKPREVRHVWYCKFKATIMSTQTITSPKPEEAGELGPAMKGADVLVSALEREGVDVVFAYPGGASMELHNLFEDNEKFAHYSPRTGTGRWFYGSWMPGLTGEVER